MNTISSVEVFKWKKIKREYKSFYDSGTEYSPFLSAEFIDLTLKHKIFFSASRRKKFYVIKYKTKHGLIYAPVLDDGKSLSIIGDYTSASYTGLIYSKKVSSAELVRFVHLLSKSFRKNIVFKKLPPFDQIYTDLNLQEQTTCVKIDFESSFEDYFNSLKKNVRQNYRTAFNRLNREGKTVEIKFYVNQIIPKSIKRKLISLYIKRSKHWDKNNRRLINVLHRKYFDLMNNALAKVKNNFCSVLYIDGNICGFMLGILREDMKICTIPRLAIDVTYGVYCPGLILIVDSIKFLIKKGCICLDLSRGEEQYKFTAGGNRYILLGSEVKCCE